MAWTPFFQRARFLLLKPLGIEGGDPPGGNPYLALLAAADSLADLEASQTQSATAAVPAAAAADAAAEVGAAEALPAPAMAQSAVLPSAKADPAAQSAAAPATATDAAAAGAHQSPGLPMAAAQNLSIRGGPDGVWEEVAAGLDPPERPAQQQQPPQQQPQQSQQPGHPQEQPPTQHSVGGAAATAAARSGPRQHHVQPQRLNVRPPSAFAATNEPFLAAGHARNAAPQQPRPSLAAQPAPRSSRNDQQRAVR